MQENFLEIWRKNTALAIDQYEDTILLACRQFGLDNHQENRSVKVCEKFLEQQATQSAVEQEKIAALLEDSRRQIMEFDAAVCLALATWSETIAFRDDRAKLKEYMRITARRGHLWEHELQRDISRVLLEIKMFSGMENTTSNPNHREEVPPYRYDVEWNGDSRRYFVKIALADDQKNSENRAEFATDVKSFVTAHPEMVINQIKIDLPELAEKIAAETTSFQFRF